MAYAVDGQEPGASANGTQPRALIVTIYGLYARQLGGWLSISSLVRLMASVGVEESAVRSSISRLKRTGLLDAQEREGAAGYALSERAHTVLREGDRRIFERKRAAPGDEWILAVFSVPESERDKRHRLRRTLSGLGFGTVASGVWIAPATMESEAADALERAELSKYVDLFRAEYLAFRPEPEQVASWWDLEGLERMYEEFVVGHKPVLTRWRRRRRADDPTAFADYVRLVTDWRRLPFLDPGLAPELLPADWLGAQAADTFFELNTRLAPAAQRHVDTVIERQAGRTA